MFYMKSGISLKLVICKTISVPLKVCAEVITDSSKLIFMIIIADKAFSSNKEETIVSKLFHSFTIRFDVSLVQDMVIIKNR